MPKAQDLLFIQMLQTSSLCWLLNRGLPTLQLNAFINAADNTLEINFGIPAANESDYKKLLDDWVQFAKKVERMHILLQLLAETQNVKGIETMRERWFEEGRKIKEEVFSKNFPGTFDDLDATVNSFKD